MIWCWSFLGILISLFHISWMRLIWFNIDLFPWIFVLKMFLSLCAVMTWDLLNFPVSCWLDISSRTCWNVVGSFLPILSIQTLVLFCSVKLWFRGIFFVYWVIYDMLWCSHYCEKMPIWLPLGGKLTFTSDIPSLMKGWSERSILMLEGWRYLFQS